MRTKKLALAVAALALALLALGPGTAAAQPTLATITHSEVLPIRSGQLETVKVTCPKGYQAINGSAAPLPPGVQLVKSARLGASWLFLFSPSTSSATTVTVVVTCVKTTFKSGGAKLKLKVGVGYSPYVVIPKKINPTSFSGPNIKLIPKCPADMAPVGSGISLKPAGAKQVSPGAALVQPIYPVLQEPELMPVHGGLELSLESRSGPDIQARAEVDCISRTAKGRHRGRRRSRRTPAVRISSERKIGQPFETLTIQCDKGQAPTSTGFSFDPTKFLFVLGTHPEKGRMGRWAIANGSTNDEAITLYLLCMRAHQRSLTWTGGPY